MLRLLRHRGLQEEAQERVSNLALVFPTNTATYETRTKMKQLEPAAATTHTYCRNETDCSEYFKHLQTAGAQQRRPRALGRPVFRSSRSLSRNELKSTTVEGASRRRLPKGGQSAISN